MDMYSRNTKPENICYIAPIGSNKDSYSGTSLQRMRLGQGLKFRSQYNGICPNDYMRGENNMCYPTVRYEGSFYKKKLSHV